MDEDNIDKAEAWLVRHDSRVIGRLGFGIHGIVYRVEHNALPGSLALKIHYSKGPYRREKEIYERLKEAAVLEILGFRVPQLIGFDDTFSALELTIVKPPWVLDFAGAWLDFPPEFPDEVWDDWRRKNEEQFGADWPVARLILSELEDLGIHMHDPSPANIHFR